jgi:cardiolipin synthase
VVSSGPDRTFYPIHELFVSAISAADERVWIVCPYVLPDEALLVALSTAAHRGVDVRILMPRRGDSRLVTAAMRSYFDEMLANGVRLYEYLPGMHHGKTLVVDDELAVVGTANFDNRSFRLNFEVAVAVHGSAAAAALAEGFEHDLESAAPVAVDRRLHLGAGSRLAEAGARLFSPLL